MSLKILLIEIISSERCEVVALSKKYPVEHRWVCVEKLGIQRLVT